MVFAPHLAESPFVFKRLAPTLAAPAVQAPAELFPAGSVVLAKWHTSWYEATVTEVNGTSVKVHYADNTDGTVTTSEIAWAGK